MKLTRIIVDAHDRDRIKRDANTAKHIGEIRVTVFRKQTPEESHRSTLGMNDKTNLEIAEKAVKGQTLSHGTEYVLLHVNRGLRS